MFIDLVDLLVLLRQDVLAQITSNRHQLSSKGLILDLVGLSLLFATLTKAETLAWVARCSRAEVSPEDVLLFTHTSLTLSPLSHELLFVRLQHVLLLLKLAQVSAFWTVICIYCDSSPCC